MLELCDNWNNSRHAQSPTIKFSDQLPVGPSRQIHQPQHQRAYELTGNNKTARMSYIKEAMAVLQMMTGTNSIH